MQKCETDPIFAQLRPLALLRLLHPYDHLEFGENFGGGVYYCGAGRQIVLIRGIVPGAAPVSTLSWCLAAPNSRTDSGVNPTRYSCSSISFGTSIRIRQAPDQNAAYAQSPWMWYDSSWETGARLSIRLIRAGPLARSGIRAAGASRWDKGD